MTLPSSIRALSACLLAALLPLHAIAQHAVGGPAQARDPAKADAFYLDGARQLERKNLEAAESDFARAVALNPSREEYVFALELTREHRVTELVQQAAQSRQKGDTARSNQLLAQARALDPGNDVVTQHTASSSSPSAPAQIETAGNVASVSDQTSTKIWGDPIGHIAGPIKLEPNSEPHQFDIRTDVREVVRQVAQVSGIRVSFDDSVAPQHVDFALDPAPYDQAMPILLRMAKLFAVPLDAHSILVARDTAEIREKFEHQLEETIYLPGSTIEQINDLGNIVRNVFELKQVLVQPNKGSIVIRGPEPTLRAANYVLADLVDGGAQVVLDLRLYEINSTRSRNVGEAFPQSVGVYSVAAQAEGLVTSNQSAVNQAISQGLIKLTGNYYTDLVQEALFLLATGLASNNLLSSVFGFTGGNSGLVGYSAGAATFNLGLNASEARELDDIQLRIGDREHGIFRVGSKYPITTSTYSNALSSSTTAALAGVTINGVSAASLAAQYLGSGSSVTIPQITFEDIGLTLTTTPSVQRSGDISLDIELKIQSLTGSTALGNPILSSRYLKSVVSVPEGTPAVLAAAVSKTESAALTGIPGLSDLPGFQGAADNVVELDKSELVLTITPHVVRRRANAMYGPRIVFNRPAGAEY
jgi:Flp pilus assembly secretin CpaC